ncbi:MAG: UDP-N-acetylmuramoyl-L-alanyl-D-glutamate--2,6-diaminopimelate ligase [Bacteroidaceae bacterium]|nr:UDP-N-acetylmuramoyl-L-alanyl-D-glutamate--2,6-diaminopimelate ligase [Bacteroidaceae bacterium]MBR5890878.1 UDP-N-acetylmuramoyl-L-alanyl-D-glutamate--2,6-diaminopimelate ligase [Bacteroidaceae bacterium]
MQLNNIIKEVQFIQLIMPNDIPEITGVNIDSRLVKGGDMFIAMRGTQVDGHKYISAAEEQGAAAIVCETLPERINPNVAYIKVADSQAVAGKIATTFYGDPSQRLKLVGVTGTNGKTTIATLLYELFREMGHKCGLLSTVCNYIDGAAYPSTHTTPDVISLNSLLGKMADEGCEYVFMEVSSHSLAQERVGGLRFAGGIFTNLTRDHMDFHNTMDEYLRCKKSFFDKLPSDAFAITNLDDKNGPVMVQNTRADIKKYSARTLGDYKGRIVETHLDGMLLEFNRIEFTTHLTGRFNVSNLLAIFGAAVELGKDPQEVLRVLSSLKPVSGRFETIHSKEGYSAIVDYAHTPDAIKNVLGTVNEVLRGRGSIITVVGAGGNRDKGKRPIMAQEAVKASSRVIITSDNPRFEEPQEIIDDMLAGLDNEQKKKVISIVDRKEAIKTACALASKGDVVVIAGKGHENYQDIKGVKHHFDDKEVVKEIFNNQ